jgi:hypothetical protein
MPPPVYSPGQVVGAADVNSWFLPLAAYKLTGTARSSTTTRTLDPDLQLTVAANSVYEINAYLSYDTANTGGIGLAFGFTGPTGVSGQWAALYRISGDTATASGAGPVGAADFGMTQFAGSGGSWAAGHLERHRAEPAHRLQTDRPPGRMTRVSSPARRTPWPSEPKMRAQEAASRTPLPGRRPAPRPPTGPAPWTAASPAAPALPAPP